MPKTEKELVARKLFEFDGNATVTSLEEKPSPKRWDDCDSQVVYFEWAEQIIPIIRKAVEAERLDRSELKGIKDILFENQCHLSCSILEDDNEQVMGNIAKQILALYPDEKEIRAQIDALRVEISDLNKKLDDREGDLINAKKEVAEEIKRGLREHWVEYDTSRKPNWVRATIAGTQEYIEGILGKPCGKG